jgi:hypothetical protein
MSSDPTLVASEEPLCGQVYDPHNNKTGIVMTDIFV